MADYFTHFSCLLDVGTPDNAARAFDLSGITGAGKDAAAAATDSAHKAADSAQTQTATLLASLTDSAKKLAASDTLTQPIKDQLAKFTSALTAGKDTDAAAALAKITALKPTAEQTALLSDLKTNFAVVALGRDFDPKDPASSGAVAKTVAAVKAKDTAGTLTGLQSLATQAKLTDDQKALVTNLAGTYGGKLTAAVDKVKAGADSVNKLSEGIKGFGL